MNSKITSFPSGDWFFKPQAISLVDTNYEMNFIALCFGDVDASNVPESKKSFENTIKTETPKATRSVDITLSLTSENVCTVGDSITISANVTNFTNVGSMSITINYNPVVLSFGRLLNFDPIFADAFVGYDDVNGIISISWLYDVDPVTIADGKLFDIKFETLGDSSNIEWDLTAGANEITDDLGNIITISELNNGVATVSSPIAEISQNVDVLTSINTASSYQWIDCNNYNTAIEGTNAQNYEVSQSGTYAVILTENACVDTSDCFSIVHSAIEENNLNSEISIFPNPSQTGIFTINLSNQNLNNSVLNVYEITGKLIVSEKLENNTIDLSILASGIYSVEIKTEKGTAKERIVICK